MPSDVLSCWPDGLELFPTSSTDVLGIYSKFICSQISNASSALGVLNDNALYKSTHSQLHCFTSYHLVILCFDFVSVAEGYSVCKTHNPEPRVGSWV